MPHDPLEERLLHHLAGRVQVELRLVGDVEGVAHARADAHIAAERLDQRVALESTGQGRGPLHDLVGLRRVAVDLVGELRLREAHRSVGPALHWQPRRLQPLDADVIEAVDVALGERNRHHDRLDALARMRIAHHDLERRPEAAAVRARTDQRTAAAATATAAAAAATSTGFHRAGAGSSPDNQGRCRKPGDAAMMMNRTRHAWLPSLLILWPVLSDDVSLSYTRDRRGVSFRVRVG